MLKVDRHKAIEEDLHKYGSILISEMSLKLDCSEETIRRDLKDLEMQNKLKRIHGGAYLPDSEDKSVPTHIRETLLAEEKGRMAAYICENFIQDNDVLMIDCSTTCLELAKEIFASNKKVTVITNSLPICTLFEAHPSDAKLVAIGGSFRAKSCSFSGYQTTKAIGNYLADKSFISCPAIDIRHGLLDNNLNEAQVRKTFMDHSRQRFLMADHTKFSDIGDYIITGFEDVDLIVTDRKPSNDWEKTLSNYKLSIHYC